MFTIKSQRKLISMIFLALFYSQSNAYAAENATLEKEKSYKGSLDFGATFANGNSKEQSIQSNFDLQNSLSDKKSNLLKARAQNTKTNKIRTRETYYVNNQTRRNISKSNFKFLEVEYVSDRYGGYNYRISETVGLGRKLLDKKDLKLTIQASAGMRQTKLTTDDKSNDVIVRFGSGFDVKLNENVSFEEDLDISFDQIATIIRSDSNVKVLISKSLYLKFGVLVQRVSNVPQGRKNSDVNTALKIGYEF